MPSIKNALNPLVLILCVISLSAHGQKHSGQNPLAIGRNPFINIVARNRRFPFSHHGACHRAIVPVRRIFRCN